MITKTFTNELGKEITINVRGVMGHVEGVDSAIQIDIFSEDSQDEWTITDWEARTIMGALEDYFYNDLRRENS